ncbi:Copper resistance protein CopC|nr:Copper resistance protein CopC [Candidatus Pantoea persica]
MLLDGQQKTVASGKSQRDTGQPNRLTVPLQAPLRPGDYYVRWHVLSVDGHKPAAIALA